MPRKLTPLSVRQAIADAILEFQGSAIVNDPYIHFNRNNKRRAIHDAPTAHRAASQNKQLKLGPQPLRRSSKPIKLMVKRRARRAPRRSRRKIRRRRVPRPARNVFSSRSGNLFPNAAQTVHKKSFTAAINPLIQSGTTLAHLTYRMNDLHNYSEGGAAIGHTEGKHTQHVTEMSTYYRKSHVVATKITFRMPNSPSNVGVNPVRCTFMIQGCYTDNVKDCLNSFREIQANKHPMLTRFIPVSHSGNYKTLSKSCRFRPGMLKAKGLGGKQDANEQVWTGPGVPAASSLSFEPFYVHFFLESNSDNPGTDESPFDVAIDVEWIVRWTDPINNTYAPVTT